MSAAQIPDVELVFRTKLAAPPDRVFTAITQADHLTRWFCDEAQSDPRGGGKLVLHWKREGSSAQPFAGEWVAFDAPRAAAFTGGQPEHPDGYGGRVEWTLDSAQGGTLLVTRHRMPPRVEYAPIAQVYALAWPRALDRLTKYLTPGA